MLKLLLGRGGLKSTARYYLVRAYFYQIASLHCIAIHLVEKALATQGQQKASAPSAPRKYPSPSAATFTLFTVQHLVKGTGILAALKIHPDLWTIKSTSALNVNIYFNWKLSFPSDYMSTNKCIPPSANFKSALAFADTSSCAGVAGSSGNPSSSNSQLFLLIINYY